MSIDARNVTLQALSTSTTAIAAGDTLEVVAGKTQGQVDLKANKDVSSTLTYAATTNLDFNLDNVRTISLTGDITFTTSNKAAIKQKTVRIIADASTRTFTFPVGWVWIGNYQPATIAASKTAILSLYCFGTNETDVIATYAAQL